MIIQRGQPPTPSYTFQRRYISLLQIFSSFSIFVFSLLRKIYFYLQILSFSPPFFFTSPKIYIFFLLIYSSFSTPLKKYIVLLQILSSFSFPVFLLLHKRYIFLLKIQGVFFNWCPLKITIFSVSKF